MLVRRHLIHFTCDQRSMGGGPGANSRLVQALDALETSASCRSSRPQGSRLRSAADPLHRDVCEARRSGETLTISSTAWPCWRACSNILPHHQLGRCHRVRNDRQPGRRCLAPLLVSLRPLCRAARALLSNQLQDAQKKRSVPDTALLRGIPVCSIPALKSSTGLSQQLDSGPDSTEIRFALKVLGDALQRVAISQWAAIPANCAHCL